MTVKKSYKRHYRYTGRKTILCLLILLYALPSLALRLPALIGTNMVLQRGRPVPVWGWGMPAEKITVAFRGSRYTTTVGKDSTWEVLLGTYQAGGPYDMRIESKDSSIQLSNILIGDVWLSSGQSNMEFGIQTERHAQEVINSPQDSLVHFFFVPWNTSLTPNADIGSAGNNALNGRWVVCSAATLQANWAWHGFSAVSYYFARDIRKATGIPLGFIGSYKGGTPAQSWISEDGLQKDPALQHYQQQHQQIVQQYPDRQQNYDAAMKAFRQEMEQWNKDQSKPRPKQPVAPDGGFNAPFNLYNGMIAPLVKYPLKGVLWYQGESNGDKLADAIEYRQLFPALINNWRVQWKQADLPFLFVQLTSFRKAAATPAEGIWPWVREAQQKALSLPATGMAVITDIGDGADIHPKNKKDVGIRLALLARRIVYHENITASGPRYLSYKQQGNKIVLTFDDTGKQLLIKDSMGSTELKGFGIAGKDRVFHWAQATIKGNQVIVYSEEVPGPVAVRYNWADNPPGNLYNQEGLPAAPFRTDDWEPGPDYNAAPLLEWEKKFTDFSFQKVAENGHVLPYRFYQPANLDTKKKYPLVLFFHGAGERGTDNRKQFLRFPTVKFWETTPCYVIAPQCPEPPKGGPDGEAVWVQTGFGWPSHTMKAKPSWPMQLSMELLDSVIKQYNIDTSRIYVTGLSMGGFATWEILQREGERFAAAVPVCGGADTSYASKMTNIPIWALHGDADSTVWPSRSIDMVKAIERNGGNKVKLTIYPGVGHGAWTPTYSNPEIWNWLFTHTRQPAVKPISGSQVQPGPVKARIALFRDDKAAAISYSFDDGIRDQYELAYPMLQRSGIHATFFVITSVIPDRQEEVAAKKPGSAGGISWEKLREMAAAGHEIASHSWSHPNLPKLNDQQLNDEIYKADSSITSRLGKAPFTFAYPYNAFDERVHAAVMQQHIASRDYQQAFGNPRFTLAFANSWADKQIREHKWGVAMIHAIQTGFDAFTSPDILEQHFAYVQQHTTDLWIETFGNVARYTKERDSTTLTITQSGKRQLRCHLSTRLDTAVYHYPLTLIVEIPAVRKVRVKQGGKTLPVTVLKDRLMFDALPGQEEILVRWD